MHVGKTLFAQLMDFLPRTTFQRIVKRCDGNRGVRTFTCAEQFRAMAFAQLTYRESLRDIEVCLSAQPAPFRSKAAIKLHTLIDLHGPIPSFIHISDGKMHDVNALDLIAYERGAYYVFDRGYVDFARLHTLHRGRFFVTRAKRGMNARRLYSQPVDRTTGLICDQIIELEGYYSHQSYPEKLRRIRFKDPESGKTFVFLTNDMTLPALTICLLYKHRWRVELFFKWIKQHLRLKCFYSHSPNAVKSQIWIAISVYVLVAIIKKRLKLEASLYTLLQILSGTLFEKMPLNKALSCARYTSESEQACKQLNLL